MTLSPSQGLQKLNVMCRQVLLLQHHHVPRVQSPKDISIGIPRHTYIGAEQQLNFRTHHECPFMYNTVDYTLVVGAAVVVDLPGRQKCSSSSRHVGVRK